MGRRGRGRRLCSAFRRRRGRDRRRQARTRHRAEAHVRFRCSRARHPWNRKRQGSTPCTPRSASTRARATSQTSFVAIRIRSRARSARFPASRPITSSPLRWRWCVDHRLRRSDRRRGVQPGGGRMDHREPSGAVDRAARGRRGRGHHHVLATPVISGDEPERPDRIRPHGSSRASVRPDAGVAPASATSGGTAAPSDIGPPNRRMTRATYARVSRGHRPGSTAGPAL